MSFTDVWTEISTHAWPIIISVLGILILVSVISVCWKALGLTCKKAILFVKRQLMFSSILRYLLQAFLMITLSSMFNLRESYFDPELRDEAEAATSATMLALLTCFTIFTYFFLRNNKHRLHEPKFQSNYGSLYIPGRPDYDPTQLIPFLFCLRRLVTGVIIVFMT